MNLDIIPYTQEEAETLGRCLAKLRIGSIGPAEAVHLLQIATALDELIKTQEPTVQQVLRGYRNRLMDICNVAASQQAEVIATLERLIKG